MSCDAERPYSEVWEAVANTYEKRGDWRNAVLARKQWRVCKIEECPAFRNITHKKHAEMVALREQLMKELRDEGFSFADKSED